MGYIDENEQIIKELLEDQKIKIGGLINYAYFSELYQPYRKKLNEVEFAEVLGISRDSYFYIKNQKGRAKVLKEKIKKANEETKKEIIQELIRNKKIEPGQLIDYKKFQELFEIYKEKTNENEFARLLGISYENYNSLRNAGKKAKVLKDKVVKATDNEKQKIIDNLIKSCKIEIGKLIDYKEFKDVYEPYKKIITEDEFAGLLGISYENYKSIKNKGTKAKLLKDRVVRITDKEKQKIIDDLIKSCKIEIGKFIDYKEFKEIYKPHKEIITEKDFANLLGINSQNFRIIKNKRN